MKELTDFEQEILTIFSLNYPYSNRDITTMYNRLNKSFDLLRKFLDYLAVSGQSCFFYDKLNDFDSGKLKLD